MKVAESTFTFFFFLLTAICSSCLTPNLCRTQMLCFKIQKRVHVTHFHRTVPDRGGKSSETVCCVHGGSCLPKLLMQIKPWTLDFLNIFVISHLFLLRCRFLLLLLKLLLIHLRCCKWVEFCILWSVSQSWNYKSINRRSENLSATIFMNQQMVSAKSFFKQKYQTIPPSILSTKSNMVLTSDFLLPRLSPPLDEWQLLTEVKGISQQ